MMEQMKEIVKLFSEEELLGNMKKHNVAVRAMDNYEGDHVFMDKEGIYRFFCFVFRLVFSPLLCILFDSQIVFGWSNKLRWNWHPTED